MLGLKYRLAEKKQRGPKAPISGHSDHKLSKTAEDIAKDEGVGEKTVRRAAKFSEDVDRLDESVKDAVRS